MSGLDFKLAGRDPGVVSKFRPGSGQGFDVAGWVSNVQTAVRAGFYSCRPGSGLDFKVAGRGPGWILKFPAGIRAWFQSFGRDPGRVLMSRAGFQTCRPGSALDFKVGAGLRAGIRVWF